jgi:predicted RNA-binding protein with TRAM domain
MTRQNVTDGPREILTTRCPACEGNGIVVSDETYAVDAERRLRHLAASSKSEAFLVELPSEVAGLLIGAAGSRLAEIERETGRMFAFETRDDLPADHFRVVAEGSAAKVVPTALPVAPGDELDVELLETHKHHPDDAIGRLDGYVIAVAGAAGRVGETVRARIERATRTVAYAVLADAGAEVQAPLDTGTLVEEEDAEAGAAARKPARGGGRSRSRSKPAVKAEAVAAAVEETGDEDAAPEQAVTEETAPAKKRTRRGTRGGRGRKRAGAAAAGDGKPQEAGVAAEAAAEGPDSGAEAEDVEPSAAPSDAAPAPPKKKTRRGTRGGARRKTAAAGQKVGAGPPVDEQQSAATGPEAVEDTSADGSENGAAQPKKRTRRGTRGGRGRRKPSAAANGAEADASQSTAADGEPAVVDAAEPTPADDGAGEGGSEVKRTGTRRGSRGGRGRRKPAQGAVAADADAG